MVRLCDEGTLIVKVDAGFEQTAPWLIWWRGYARICNMCAFPRLTVIVLALLAGNNAWSDATRFESLERVASRYGFPVPIVDEDSIRFRSRYSSLMFKRDSRMLVYDGVLVWLNKGVHKRKNRWGLIGEDLRTVINPLLRRNEVLRKVGYLRVMLDPGHGGEDGGALSARGLQEKRVVLDIARRTRRKLEAAGVLVNLTRYTDGFLELHDRCREARRWRADLLISIHANASGNPAAAGVETYIMPAPGFRSTGSTRPDQRRYEGNRFDEANVILGYFVHKGLVANSGGADRGVKRARFLVLKDSPCPAALVECGFLSNAQDAESLASRRHRDVVARGLTQGILTYVSRVRTAHTAAR
mgnify:CR=1 FL=1